MAKDKDYNRLIHTAQWLRLRRAVLTAHPVCERCEAAGYMSAATEVHHRRPVECGFSLREKSQLMFDSDNLMALCHACHVAIHTEMGRSGKEATRRRVDEQVRNIRVNFFND